MEAWLEFGRGPLFRLSFSVMAFGLLRVALLSLHGVIEAYRRSPDKCIAFGEIGKQTAAWLAPVIRLWRKRPLYSATSFVFHAGLLVVPVFLAAHILLWQGALGAAWPALPQGAADALTLLTVAAAIGLFCGRLFDRRARALSRRQDYVWPLLLAIPFITGYIGANVRIWTPAYKTTMLVHIYSANLIMLLIPFTKIAHCVLAPLSQLVTAVAWKFVPGAGDRVAATLGYADQPSWKEKTRLGQETGNLRPESKEVCAR